MNLETLNLRELRKLGKQHKVSVYIQTKTWQVSAWDAIEQKFRDTPLHWSVSSEKEALRIALQKVLNP